MNHKPRLRSSFDDPFNPRTAPYTEPNVIDMDDPADLEATSANPKDVRSKIGVLKKWIVEDEAK